MKDTAKTVDRVLRIAMFVVVFCGYAALITTDTFPPEILAIPVGLFLLMPLGEWLDRRYRLYKRLFLLLTVALLISIPFLFLFMDLLRVVISLIMYIQVFSMLQRKTPMSYRHLLMMALFLVIAACVLSPDPTIGIVMAAFLVASIVALAALQLYVELGQPENQMADIEAPGGEQTAYGNPGRPATWGVAAAGVLVSLVALALTGLFFAVTPRMEAGLLGRSDTAVFRTQLSDAINLSQGGYISLDQTPVMRVRFPDEPSGQYNGNLFWRASTLCQYGAGNWERNGITPLPDQPAFALSAKAAAIPALFGGGMAIRRAPHENRRVVRHIAYINDVPAEGIPLLTLVKDVRIDGASGGSALMWDPNADFTVIFKKRGAPWLEYEAVSEVEDFTPDQLRTAPDNYGEVLPFRDYRVLTYHHLSTETLRTVERVTNGKATVYDKVSALLRYLAGNQFLYSRNLPQLPSEDPIDAFLNATRLGHCELFASALALMLRSQGIPTRVVSGYRGGEWSGRDQSYVVRADMAHMWVEVFFIGIGWVTFDPSPADIQAYSTLNSIYRWVTRYTLYAKMLWYRDIVSYNRGFQIQALRNLRLGVIRYGAGLWQMRTVVRRSSATPAVAGILVAGGAAAMILVLWLTRRRRSQVLGVWLTTDQQNAIRLYRKLRRALRKKGCPCDGKTAEEIQHETAEMPWAHAVAALVEGYNRVRFGQTPLTPAEQAQWRQLLKVISSRN